mmetsp:Transcript_13901/g.23059  ORF Transcript_13901/g.23059 Transcript_13901/m.23059 type:complete len:87 (-) Transcript_13901:99-359(-)
MVSAGIPSHVHQSSPKMRRQKFSLGSKISPTIDTRFGFLSDLQGADILDSDGEVHEPPCVGSTNGQPTFFLVLPDEFITLVRHTTE